MTNKERYHALEDFANFVAGEIFDEEWDYNCTMSFPKAACHKLIELGIVGGNEENYVFFNTRRNKNGGESWVLSERRKRMKPESICCDNCYYYASELSQCYGQKYCPVVDPNDHCEDFKPCKRPSSDTIKFNKIKAIIDNWAVDDDEHELLERIADIVNDTEAKNE